MITNVDTYGAKQLVGNFQTKIEIPVSSISPGVLSRVRNCLKNRYLPLHSYRGKASILTRALLVKRHTFISCGGRYLECMEHASEDMKDLFFTIVSTDVAAYRLNGHDLGAYYSERYKLVQEIRHGYWHLTSAPNKALFNEYIAANKKHIDSRFRAQADFCDLLLEQLVVGKSLVFDTY